jgi:hypothetical protein
VRVNRWEWLGRFFRPTFRTHPAKVRRDPADRKRPADWMVVLPEGNWCFVTAMTKSEARAAAKKEFGISGRLPVGSVVARG